MQFSNINTIKIRKHKTDNKNKSLSSSMLGLATSHTMGMANLAEN